MRSGLLVVMLAACRPSSMPCGDHTREQDGACVSTYANDTDVADTASPSPGALTVSDVLAGLPTCVPLPANSRLDLVRGCLDGGCVGMTLQELRIPWGDPDCTDYDGTWYCYFENSNYLYVDDDGHGSPDPLGTLDYLVFQAAYPDTGDSGSSAEETPSSRHGVGVGANFRCIVDELGTPFTVSFYETDSGWYVDNANWLQGSLDDGVWITVYSFSGLVDLMIFSATR